MLFVDRKYVSEHTRWMEAMLQSHPEWEQARQEGRAEWWDRPQEAADAASFSPAREAQKPYPYDVNF